MESTLQLEIVTPDKVVVSQPVDYIGVPGVEGEFGVLPNHIPMLSALAVGPLYFRTGSKTEYVFVSGGFAEISGNKVTILAESAELSKDIDVTRAEAARKRAEERLAAQTETIDATRAHAALQRSVERLRVATLQ